MYVFGPSGTGKTHLMRACATALKDIVVYIELTCADLMNKYQGIFIFDYKKLF